MKLTRQLACTCLIIGILMQIALTVIFNWTRTHHSSTLQTTYRLFYRNNRTISQRDLTLTNYSTSKKGVFIQDDGCTLAEMVKNVCKEYSTQAKKRDIAVHHNNDGKLKFCPIAKIGSTFWRRVFLFSTLKNNSEYKTPFDIPPGRAIKQSGILKSHAINTQPEFSFLFVRNPFSRVLSAYIDKLVAPNPTFWTMFGKPAVTRFRPADKTRHTGRNSGGHDVTFTEFVKFVTYTEMSSGPKNEHIVSIKLKCQPCLHNFSYVGRMERFKDDAFYIMNRIGLNDVVQSFKSSFAALSDDDAITDSIRDPISNWKPSIKRFISWKKALSRIWLKLQMRGLISKDIALNLSEAMVNNITANEFIRIARKAHQESDPVKLKEQKEIVKMEAFRSVPLSVLRQFVNAFYDDFIVFGYEPFPSKYFERSEEPTPPTIFFNFTHLN